MLSHRTVFVVFCLFLCLVVFPTFAQSDEPEPTSTPRPTTTTILTEVSDTVQAIGIFNFVTAGIVVLLLFGAWKGLSPLIQANVEASKRATEAQNALVDFMRGQSNERTRIEETRQLQAEALQNAARAQEKTATLMEQMETRSQAERRSAEQVESMSRAMDMAAAKVNTHISAEVGAVNTKLQQAVEAITEVRTDLEAKATKEDLSNGLSPLVDKIGRVTHEIGELKEMITQALSPKPTTS